MLALEWLKNAHGIMEKLEATQLENIKKAATAMADSIEAGPLGTHVRMWSRNNSR